ncbi:Autophagy protein 22 [Exophiala xenobiotica]|uniref:Autophagy-related protein n=1 Tax=Lithohypha guttulata TaxID=1690604 RepID=A0ABR0KJ98_9EURO|nr:Autophagy protein 22 [Lithohypha guttulata]KAK5322730.1 Autophagy protein 22 [Exophiala xenobiotica]
MVPRNDPFQFHYARPALPRTNSKNSHRSLISPTPSVEGDDEHDSDDETDESLTNYTDTEMGPQVYEDEDTRPTSQKELAGWYAYGWAAEVFAICAMGSFLPITLEQLARDQGVLLSDGQTPCRASWPSVDTGPSSLLLSTSKHRELPACIIRIGTVELNTASFAMYTFSISVLIQSLLIVSMSGAADHGRFRKQFLLGFAFTGAIACIGFLGVLPKLYLLGALLAIISNTCFGASFVLLNSYIPLLVRNHPSVQEAQNESQETDPLLNSQHQRFHNHQDGLDESVSSLLPRDEPDDTRPLAPVPAAMSEEMKLATRISSNGIGIGYMAGLLVQIGSIFVIAATGSTTFSLRLVLCIVGLWWGLFSIPTALWLRPRPGPPLPAHLTGWTGYAKYSWGALFKTIRQARKLRDIVTFLAAWFLLSDAVASISGTAILFAKTNLGMKPTQLALIGVLGTISGCFGAFYWSTFSRYFNLRASQTIIACVLLLEIVPLYGILGFIPAVKDAGFGLQQPSEIYCLGVIYGLVLGGLSSYCRAFFGELIPPGFEASFYSLYAITDKGSSVFGPAIIGAITDRYGDIRPAFVFLVILVAMPLPLLLLVDVDRGKADAAAMALELEGKKESDERRDQRIPTIRLLGDDDD